MKKVMMKVGLYCMRKSQSLGFVPSVAEEEAIPDHR